MSLERDLLTRMFKSDLEMSERLLAIGDYAMSAEALSSAIEKIHQIADLGASVETLCGGDGVPNAGAANSEIQAGTGQPSVRTECALTSESASVVYAPLSKSSPRAAATPKPTIDI